MSRATRHHPTLKPGNFGSGVAAAHQMAEYDAMMQEDYLYEEYREQCLVDEKHPMSIEEWRLS